jgi:hypothetical protein
MDRRDKNRVRWNPSIAAFGLDWQIPEFADSGGVSLSHAHRTTQQPASGRLLFVDHKRVRALACFMREELLMDASARNHELNAFTDDGTRESRRDAVAFRGLPHPLLTAIAGAVTGIGGAVASREFFYLAGTVAIAIAWMLIVHRRRALHWPAVRRTLIRD